MRFSWFAGVVLFAAGCGGSNPRYYLITLDEQPLQAGSLPSGCYVKNFTQAYTGTQTNVRSTFEWTQWDGPDGKSYLDIGKSANTLDNLAKLHDASAGNISTIESKDGKSYTANVVTKATGANATNTVTTTATVSFTDNGAAPKGTIKYTVQRACTGGGCGDDATFTCSPTELTFTGRRIDAQNFAVSSQGVP